MADQMTPAELRAAAALLDRMAEINAEQHPGETLARKQLDIGATAARRLADVIEDMEGYYGGENVGEWRVDCDAGEVWRIARGESNERESNA